jgi:hypothetical protein
MINKNKMINKCMNYYVYHLIDPRTNQPFYVGKGKDKRAWNHLKHNTNGSAKNKRIQEIREDYQEPLVSLIAENLSEEDAYKLEDNEILKYGRIGIEPNGVLTNNRLSAFPPDMTDDVKNAISESRKGIQFSNSHKKKLSNAKKGKTWEEIFGEETAAKMRQRASQSRKAMPEETRQKISESKKGKRPHSWSDEARRKSSNTHKGQPKSESHKEKIRHYHAQTKICPHCGKKGNGPSMLRWHFDNCRLK